MGVNDVLVHGAEPLYFLDYIGTGRLDPAQVEAIVSGVVQGCLAAGCALIGGETAELPGFYAPGEYDLAGFAVGIVERKKIVDGAAVRPGDVVLGLQSSGLHANGYSLARRVIFDELRLPLDSILPGTDRRVGDVLLEPTRIYVKPILALLKRLPVRAMAHVTGGGITGNLPRVLPKGCRARISRSAWKIPPVFEAIQRGGRIGDAEMFRTFNMGIGYVLVTARKHADEVVRVLGGGETVLPIGEIVAAGYPARVVVVVSDKERAQALERARAHGVAAVWLNPKDFGDRAAYDAALGRLLEEHRVGLVCLAGFMRILTPELVRAFAGRVLNIHPSLLPAFPGLHAQRQALDYGVKVAGATVHFVDEGVDTGPIALQASVPVQPDDTEESLSARILAVEHRIYPEAVRLFAEGRLRLAGRKVIVR